jgi:hypothetical protein
MPGKSRHNGQPMRSPLTAKANAKKNTQAGRKKMPASDFGVPAKKQYRIDDAAHARVALGRVAQNGTAAEKKQVQSRVARKYPSINVTGLKGKSGKGKK